MQWTRPRKAFCGRIQRPPSTPLRRISFFILILSRSRRYMSHEVFFLFYFFLLYSFFSLFFVLFSFFFLLFHSSLCSFPFTFLNSLHAPQHRERTEGKSKRQEETRTSQKNLPLTVRNYFFLLLSFSFFLNIQTNGSVIETVHSVP